MSFMARNAAAMPQLVCKNCRRLKPRCLPFTSASSLIRASTFFWVALCGGGRYSPFDTIWVGIGVAADAASAPATRRCSRSLSQLLIVLLPALLAWTNANCAHLAERLATCDPLKVMRTARGVLSGSRDQNRKTVCEFDRTSGTHLGDGLNAQTCTSASDVIRQLLCPKA